MGHEEIRDDQAPVARTVHLPAIVTPQLHMQASFLLKYHGKAAERCEQSEQAATACTAAAKHLGRTRHCLPRSRWSAGRPRWPP